MNSQLLQFTIWSIGIGFGLYTVFSLLGYGIYSLLQYIKNAV